MMLNPSWQADHPEATARPVAAPAINICPGGARES
jgi:hypothetical protein